MATIFLCLARLVSPPGSGGHAGLEDHLRGLGRLATTAGAATESQSQLVVSCDHVGLLLALHCHSFRNTTIQILILNRLLRTLSDRILVFFDVSGSLQGGLSGL